MTERSVEMYSTSLQQQENKFTPQKKPFSRQVLAGIVLTVLLLIFSAFKIHQLSREVRQLSDQRQSLGDQVVVKRINENSLRKMINKDYIEFKQDQHAFLKSQNDKLIKFYSERNIKTLADFGCGRCQYIINIAAQTGIQVFGFDATPFSNDSRIQFMNMAEKVDLGRKFDYVQSFEVGEHIFSDFEDNFIYNIATHAQKGIVMSWGVLGQGGYLHVNNRPFYYIREKIENYGFKYNEKLSKEWKNFDFSRGFAIYDKI